MMISRRIGFILQFFKKPSGIIISFILLFALCTWLLKDYWLPIFQKDDQVITQEENIPTVIPESLYYIQVGAFSLTENALALEADLQAYGFETTIVKPGGLYIVQVGAFSVKEDAEEQLAELHSLGFEGFIKYE